MTCAGLTSSSWKTKTSPVPKVPDKGRIGWFGCKNIQTNQNWEGELAEREASAPSKKITPDPDSPGMGNQDPAFSIRSPPKDPRSGFHLGSRLGFEGELSFLDPDGQCAPAADFPAQNLFAERIFQMFLDSELIGF